MDEKNKACVTKSLCKTLREFIEKGTILGFGFGIPCYVAGTAMFCACYACCCCREHFVGAEVATSDKGAPPPTTTISGMIRVWDRGLLSLFATRTLACLAVRLYNILSSARTLRDQQQLGSESRETSNNGDWGGGRGAESWETSSTATKFAKKNNSKTSVSYG
jgi:hypothetical protein